MLTMDIDTAINDELYQLGDLWLEERYRINSDKTHRLVGTQYFDADKGFPNGYIDSTRLFFSRHISGHMYITVCADNREKASGLMRSFVYRHDIAGPFSFFENFNQSVYVYEHAV